MKARRNKGGLNIIRRHVKDEMLYKLWSETNRNCVALQTFNIRKNEDKTEFLWSFVFSNNKKKLNHARKQIRRNVRRAPGLESVFTSQVVIGGVPLW